MPIKPKLVIIPLILTLTACRSNQAAIQQAVYSLSEQAPQGRAAPPPETPPWLWFAAGAALMLLGISVIISMALYRNWRRGLEQAANDKARAAYKVREAHWQAHLPQPAAPPTAQIPPYAAQPPGYPPPRNPNPFA